MIFILEKDNFNPVHLERYFREQIIEEAAKTYNNFKAERMILADFPEPEIRISHNHSVVKSLYYISVDIVYLGKRKDLTLPHQDDVVGIIRYYRWIGQFENLPFNPSSPKELNDWAILNTVSTLKDGKRWGSSIVTVDSYGKVALEVYSLNKPPRTKYLFLINKQKFEDELQKEFHQQTGKNAIWQGKKTKIYIEWKEKRGY